MPDNKIKFLRGTAEEYAAAEKDNDTFYFTTDDGKLYIGNKEISGGGSITIDDALSDTSENAVQNKIISTALEEKALKTLYSDTTINVGRKPDTTVGDYSTAEGHGNIASGANSHAEGNDTTASNRCSHAEGVNTEASGFNSHAEGNGTIASGANSHAEGVGTTASNRCSHAGGWLTTASGDYSFAHGNSVNTSNENEVAFGSYNTSNADTLFSVGDGTSSTDTHNAFEITTNGGKLHGNNIITTAIIDDVLSETSENPVKNKVIYAALKGGSSSNSSKIDILSEDPTSPETGYMWITLT